MDFTTAIYFLVWCLIFLIKNSESFLGKLPQVWELYYIWKVWVIILLLWRQKPWGSQPKGNTSLTTKTSLSWFPSKVEKTHKQNKKNVSHKKREKWELVKWIYGYHLGKKESKKKEWKLLADLTLTGSVLWDPSPVSLRITLVWTIMEKWLTVPSLMT